MKKIQVLALACVQWILVGCSEQSATTMSEKKATIEWPDLDTITFTAGRPATFQDVAEGKAAFVLERDGVVLGTPIKMTIPQYAFEVDAESGNRAPCIIIQAEGANGQQIVGAVSVVDRTISAGLMADFELLGTTKPK